MAGLTDKKVERFMNGIAAIADAIQEEYDELPIDEESIHPVLGAAIDGLDDVIDQLGELLGTLKGGAA